MLLQNILFPQYGICSEYDLYFRMDDNYNYSFQNQTVSMDSSGWVHFDTYFNGFIKNKWSKYTKLKNLYLELELEGNVRITLLNKFRERDGLVTNKRLDEIEVNYPTRKTLKIPFKQFDEAGMYTFSLYAISDGCIFYGGCYGTEIEPEEISEVNLAICICTFKREQFIKRNVANLEKAFLSDNKPDLPGHLHIFISDNGKTLSDVSNSPNVHIFPNKNVGGAGGFTRCLIEVLNRPELKITHALMMDDDIVLDPQVIQRTFAFLSILLPKFQDAFLGGAMLRLDKQYIQTESGAVWNAGSLLSRKANLNLSTCEGCLYNDVVESCDYNAWWYCVTPMKYVTPANLPMPIFIRGDDVEYGLRNTEHLILLNGICVWHEPFENKYSSMMYYYIFRNRLIDNAVRSIDYPIKRVIKDLTDQWTCEIRLCRYKNAHLLIDGVLDFLKGIEWLKSTDAEKLNQSVLSKGYKLIPVNELDFKFQYADLMIALGFRNPKDSVFMRFRIKYDLLRHDQKLVIPAYDPNPRFCVNAKEILNYDYASGKGFVTCYDKAQYNAEKGYFRKCVAELKKKYSTMYSDYNEHNVELTNLEFWNKYLIE